ncbi:PLP-dependent aminotransferase family protein [Variovorax sp. J22R193]|uniref:MocR-like pyridoxine biosynthesis transcription factor PdxR n=1 Tax=Variovorax fucosicus TaxID=3053517 RepID=UPI002575F76C|nr:PLP-dependent aminotransferase family protein [Variovorax sp. J22R193]MDM0037908.1 PLP-dependent aminotransferase family protein [Variovorax sp. J22R193]
MESTEPLLSIQLCIPAPGSRTRVRELHRQLRAAILSGRLAAGLRLPATRALALSLGVGRNTVVAAYDLLLGEGYVEAVPGSGHRVAALVARRTATTALRRTATEPMLQQRLAPAYRGLVGSADREQDGALPYDFRLGVPEKTSVHFDVWRRLSARNLRSLGRREVGYGPPRGQPSLREAIAAHVSLTRAVACHADDVLVTAGAQQAFDLLARVLVTPGKSVVAVEHPGYPPTRIAFEAAGARIARVPVDEEGLVVDKLPRETRVICVTPSHQFPLGCALSPRRRVELLAFAERHGAVIVEDDYDGEFRYDSRALDALQTLDQSGSVFFVGTFSKSLFPALRLGFVVAPAWAMLPLVVAKERADSHCNLLAQETLAAFIAEGHLARHVRQMRGLYAQRRGLLLAQLARDFEPWLEPLPGTAGLHLAARAKRDLDVEHLVRQARQIGVGVSSIADYGAGLTLPRGLLFGFGALEAARIHTGLDRLRSLFAKLPPR